MMTSLTLLMVFGLIAIANAYLFRINVSKRRFFYLMHTLGFGLLAIAQFQIDWAYIAGASLIIINVALQSVTKSIKLFLEAHGSAQTA